MKNIVFSDSSEEDSSDDEKIIQQINMRHQPSQRKTRRRRTQFFDETKTTTTKFDGITLNEKASPGAKKDQSDLIKQSSQRTRRNSLIKFTENTTKNEEQPKNKPQEVVEIPKNISKQQKQQPKLFFSNLLFNDFKTFTIKRSTSIMIYGKRIKFSILDGENVLFSSKFKGMEKIIPISAGAECHMKASEHDAYVITGNDFHDFSLREKSATGREKLTCRFFSYGKTMRTRRSVVTLFFHQSDSESNDYVLRLTSRKPVVDDDGNVLHDFGGRKAVQSIRNVAYIDKESNLDLIYLRKTDDDILELDSKVNIGPLSLFAIAISDFMCNLISE